MDGGADDPRPLPSLRGAGADMLTRRRHEVMDSVAGTTHRRGYLRVAGRRAPQTRRDRGHMCWLLPKELGGHGGTRIR
eukprot:2182180-Prymnesium_polylepis.1